MKSATARTNETAANAVNPAGETQTITEGLASLAQACARHQVTVARITLKRHKQTYEHAVDGVELAENATPIASPIEGRFDDSTITIYCVSPMRAQVNAELQTLATTAATAAQNWTEPASRLTLVKATPGTPESNETKTQMLGNSESMRELVSDIRRAARSTHVVLIIGESGTGKTTAASMIHEQSQRSTKSFVAINCAAIPDTLIESELFGYEKGAFTGAVATKQGLFELAEEGTLFLDEIGELKLELQAKLLTAIEQQKIRRLGATKDVKCDVRIIAASSRDLQQMVAEGKFREDLYYRLAVLDVPIAPLRDRRSDIPMIVRQRLVHEQTVAKLASPFKIEEDAIKELTAYSWPGNIRELQNIISRLATRAEDTGAPITLAAARKEIARFSESSNRTLLKDGSVMLPVECRKLLPNESLVEFTTRVRRALIETVRNETGSMKAAAGRLSFNRTALTKLLSRLYSNESDDQSAVA